MKEKIIAETMDGWAAVMYEDGKYTLYIGDESFSCKDRKDAIKKFNHIIKAID